MVHVCMHGVYIINPQRMCCRVTVVVLCVCVCVCVCVCLSITMLTATYLVYASQVRYHRVLYGIFKILVVWLLLKILFKSSGLIF